MAGCSYRPQRSGFGADCCRRRALHRAVICRGRTGPCRRRIRKKTLPDSKTSQPPVAQRLGVVGGQSVLYLQPVHQGFDLQRHVDARSTAAIFSGFDRPGLYDAPGDGSFEVFDEYFSELGSCAAESIHVTQWRDQYVARQRQLDACARRRCAIRIIWGIDFSSFPCCGAGLF